MYPYFNLLLEMVSEGNYVRLDSVSDGWRFMVVPPSNLDCTVYEADTAEAVIRKAYLDVNKAFNP